MSSPFIINKQLTIANTASGGIALSIPSNARLAFDGPTGTRYLSFDTVNLNLHNTNLIINNGCAVIATGPLQSASGINSWSSDALKLNGLMPDSATAIGALINTTNTFATTGAKLLSVQNNSSEKMYVDKDGGVRALSFTNIASAGQGLAFGGNDTAIRTAVSGATIYLSDQSVFLLTINTTVGADFTGLGNGATIRLKSPDGTTYKLSIANGGTVSITT